MIYMMRLYLSNKMQKIISQISELKPYLARIPKQRHQDAILHLIRLGLEVNKSHCCKQNQQSQFMLKREIDRIKDNIEELNYMVRCQCHRYCKCCPQEFEKVDHKKEIQSSPFLNDRNTLLQNSANREKFKGKTQEKKIQTQEKNIQTQEKKIQKPERDVTHTEMERELGVETISFNPFQKRKTTGFRHHLDDSGARQSLHFPASSFLETKEPPKRRSQEYKQHVYQQQINKEQLSKIKEQKEESLEKLKRDRTISDYSKATSKIKSLIDKDRIRYMQRQRHHQFKEGFNKYEYSDENQMEESSVREESRGQIQTHNRFADENTYSQNVQSSLKASNQASSQQSHNKPSSKKQFQHSKKDVSSKLQSSLGEEIRQELRSKQSGKVGSQKYYQGSSERVDKEIEEQDEVVSNSSSFSQFSINNSRQKEIGKISRRSGNE